MFTKQELDRIQLEAMKQALQAARLAKTDPAPMLPVQTDWPFPLTHDDRDFLKINKISPA